MTDGTPPALAEVLARSKGVVDRATARACEQIIGAHRPSWSTPEVEQGLRDLWKLHEGGDCSYANPSIGVSYALWYHGRRTHQAMRVLATPLAHERGKLRIVDLGCGTGATACAVALVVDGLMRMTASVPDEVLIEGVDASPLMVETAAAVFRALTTEVPAHGVGATFTCVPWESVQRTATKTVVHGGYLLDHSDRSDAQEIARGLLHLGKALEASSVLLTTTARKKPQLDTIGTILSENGWSRPFQLPTAARFGGGTMAECHRVRSAWYRDEHALVELSRTWRDAPPWDEGLPKWVMLRQERGRAGVAST